MLSKFSVKKPYTVLVGIVLIIVLGIVSFTNMTTDLLPDINMPYAVVITTYPGASPSQVEEVVSKPVEQAMATVSNIQNVQSISSENMSMVVLGESGDERESGPDQRILGRFCGKSHYYENQSGYDAGYGCSC